MILYQLSIFLFKKKWQAQLNDLEDGKGKILMAQYECQDFRLRGPVGIYRRMYGDCMCERSWTIIIHTLSIFGAVPSSAIASFF